MARGMRTTNNSGGGGGSIDAHGVIICDTTTMSVGDVVRVRSVYNPLITEDKTVVIIGAPLYFNVNPYDYYKVCMVQVIDNIEVELSGIFTTIDLGQTVLISSLNKTSLAGIQAILNAHQESDLLQAGDEVTIGIDNGSTTVCQLLGYNLYGEHEAYFCFKNLRGSCVAYPATEYYIPYASLTLRTSLQSVYSAINENDRKFIKQVERYSYKYGVGYAKYSDYIWTPSDKEVTDIYCGGGGAGASPVPQHQFPLFVSVNNRIKTNTSGTATGWWTSDGWAGASGNGWDFITGSGTVSTQAYTSGAWYLPCFTLRADM